MLVVPLFMLLIVVSVVVYRLAPAQSSSHARSGHNVLECTGYLRACSYDSLAYFSSPVPINTDIPIIVKIIAKATQVISAHIARNFATSISTLSYTQIMAIDISTRITTILKLPTMVFSSLFVMVIFLVSFTP